MIFTAASELIQAALEKIGVQDPNETVSAADANTGLRELNLLLDELSIDRGKIYVRTEDIETLVVGTNSYTIGTGQTINTILPLSIEQAFLRDTASDDYDYPIRVNMTEAEYNALPYKDKINRPNALFLNGKISPATIYFDYSPDKAYELHLFSIKPLTKLAAITDALSWPDGYEAYITAALGIRLAPLFKRPVPEVLVEIEARMERKIDARNAEPKPNWEDQSQPKTMDWSRSR